VTALSPARTFWEKAVLIHVECHRRRLAIGPERLSRHWFDLACLARHDFGRAALTNRNLLEDVVRHQTVFFTRSYAHFDRCLNGRFRLIPDADQLAVLRSDYDDMCRAGFVGGDAPVFDNLMDEIRDIELAANRSPRDRTHV